MAASKTFPVLQSFREPDKKTGKSIWYEPDGSIVTSDLVPGVRNTYEGDPDDPHIQELLAGLDHNGPLIGKPAEAAKAPAPASTREN